MFFGAFPPCVGLTTPQFFLSALRGSYDPAVLLGLPPHLGLPNFFGKTQARRQDTGVLWGWEDRAEQ